MLQLIASDSVTIAGRVSADGAPGVVSGNYASGSGAGGGILFASDNVNIVGTGIVSAAGAASVTSSVSYGFGGAGAPGRVKILYGASVATNGSITGTLTKGLLPPITITSTTHPDPTLTYNDDFNAVALSWNQPYPTRLGYYVLFDRNAVQPADDDQWRRLLGQRARFHRPVEAHCRAPTTSTSSPKTTCRTSASSSRPSASTSTPRRPT